MHNLSSKKDVEIKSHEFQQPLGTTKQTRFRKVRLYTVLHFYKTTALPIYYMDVKRGHYRIPGGGIRLKDGIAEMNTMKKKTEA
jgi:hypothetical protein